MTGSETAMVIVMIFTVFLGGIAFGVIAMVSVAVRREDRRYSLDGEAPDAVTRGARLVMGACSRGVVLRPAAAGISAPPPQAGPGEDPAGPGEPPEGHGAQEQR